LKTVRSGGVQLTDESLLALRERIAGAMGPVDAPHQKKSSTPTLKETYQANKHVGLAFDNALARCFNEESLRLFVPACAPAALEPGWERYRIEVASMPDAVVSASPGRKFRSCIYNASTGESKLECVYGESRRSIFCDIDRGSIGFGFMIYMYSGLGLRGDLVPDICHKRHRGSLGAWHDAGLDAVRVECGIIMNLFRGPFGKHANLQVLKGVARQFYSSERADNIVFRSCYELIVRCQCDGKLPHEFGSSDHIEATWRQLPNSEFFTTAGVMMKFSRWYSFTERARVIRRFVGEMFMILLVLGATEKFYDHVSELPFYAAEYKPVSTMFIEDDASDAEAAPPVGGLCCSLQQHGAHCRYGRPTALARRRGGHQGWHREVCQDAQAEPPAGSANLRSG
jgi:hypothetical protein